MDKLKVLIVDDHQMIVDGIKQLINSTEKCEVVAVANNGQEALEVLKILSVDLILMDIDMPIMNGLDASIKIKKDYPKTRIIILSMHSEYGMIKDLLEIGVDGYLLKNSSKTELETAINQMINGGKYFASELTQNLLNKDKNKSPKSSIALTKREHEILICIADGFTNKEIGDKLFISHRTVDTHRTNLLKKLEVKNIAELISYAIRNGLIE